MLLGVNTALKPDGLEALSVIVVASKPSGSLFVTETVYMRVWPGSPDWLLGSIDMVGAPRADIKYCAVAVPNKFSWLLNTPITIGYDASEAVAGDVTRNCTSFALFEPIVTSPGMFMVQPSGIWLDIWNVSDWGFLFSMLIL